MGSPNVLPGASGPSASALLLQAQRRHADLRLDEAERLYRQVLALAPDHPVAMGLLALILLDPPDERDSEAEAEALLRRRLALTPQDGGSLYGLARLFARRGDDAGAAALFERAAAALPHLAPAQNEWGVCLMRLGRPDAALAALDRAIALDPTYAAAHGNRAAALQALGRAAAAIDAQLTVLALTPTEDGPARAASVKAILAFAKQAGRLERAETVARREHALRPGDADMVELLAEVLEQIRRADEAQDLRNSHARRMGLSLGGAASAKAPTLLLLGAVGAGHVPLRYLVDSRAFRTLSISLLSPDQADAPLGRVNLDRLKRADAVFNTVGDADRDGGQLAAVARLCEALGKPVINPPDKLASTSRAEAQALFAGVADLIVPSVRRASAAALAALPITRPILARPVGDHGGENLARLRDEADKTAYLAGAPAERLFLTDFHDFRSADGAWRKYRLIFVDRQVFPYHVAVGDDWLVHYWRADTGRSAAKQAEEEAFFEDWRGVFGPRAAAAVEAVAQRLDLDYGGVDCALTQDGRLLLFEANACILLHLDETRRDFPYKHRHVPKIRQAFTDMVLRRAGRAAQA